MERTKIISRFNTLYLGDSLLQQVELKIGEAECLLKFNAGKVLRAEGASIFDAEARFAPALLRLQGVRSITCEGGRYQLNSTVVDFGAVASADREYIEFYLDLTGGTDPDAFMVKVKFEAKAFEFGPAEG
ncbi:hypothetical protein [Archangium lipolyticum]|uniref:hypothetical protein n=1 Tax=Archangium lipolyticum TaxID=2970465 RepID=UPI00214A02A9|nr:hypothetical protein [Archangium lipolyticum]